MNKLKKNIERVVADKALKDIHKIVESDLEQQKHEKTGVILVIVIVLCVTAFLLYKMNS